MVIRLMFYGYTLDTHFTVKTKIGNTDYTSFYLSILYIMCSYINCI